MSNKQRCRKNVYDFRGQLHKYLAGDLTLTEFYREMMPEAFDPKPRPDWYELSLTVKCHIYEYQSGAWTEEEVKSLIREAISRGE